MAKTQTVGRALEAQLPFPSAPLPLGQATCHLPIMPVGLTLPWLWENKYCLSDLSFNLRIGKWGRVRRVLTEAQQIGGKPEDPVQMS